MKTKTYKNKTLVCFTGLDPNGTNTSSWKERREPPLPSPLPPLPPNPPISFSLFLIGIILASQLGVSCD